MVMKFGFRKKGEGKNMFISWETLIFWKSIIHEISYFGINVQILKIFCVQGDAQIT